MPARLRQPNLDVLTGDLADVAANRGALEGYEALVHCARDTSPHGPEIDRQVIEAFRDVFWNAGSGLFVYTSSAWVIGPTHGPVDETCALNPPEVERDRPAIEQRRPRIAGRRRARDRGAARASSTAATAASSPTCCVTR